MVKNSFVFIINPIAGTRNKGHLESYIAEYSALYQKPYEIRYTEYAKHLPILIKELLAEGFQKIVIAGGDGTANEAAGAMLHQDCSLSIIPMGSGNGLARHLKIPLDTKQAIERIFQAEQSFLIDVGMINEHYFVSNTGIGYDAELIRLYEKTPNRGLKTYVICGIKAYFSLKRFGYKQTSENQYKNSFLIGISNASEYGYGLKSAPKASLQDGKLNWVATNISNKLSFLWVGIEFLLQKTSSTPFVQRKEVESLQLQFDTEVPVQIDGEFIGFIKQADIKILPNALRML